MHQSKVLQHYLLVDIKLPHKLLVDGQIKTIIKCYVMQ